MNTDIGWLASFEDATTETIPNALVRPPRPEAEPYTAAELQLPTYRQGDGPLVSVILPTHRDSYCLPEALQSVAAQTYDNLELLIVDSSRVKWVSQLAVDCEWIQYHAHQPQGVAAARNIGCQTAAGKYIALLDADDFWHPEKLSRQVAALEAGKDVVVSNNYEINFRNDKSPSVEYEAKTFDSPETAYFERLRNDFARTSSLVYRQNVAGETPFCESLTVREDIVFMVELFAAGTVANIDDPLVVRRRRSGSLTDRVARQEAFESRKRALSYLFSQYPELRSERQTLHSQATYALGREHLEANDRSSARRVLFVSLRSDPTNYKALALLAATLIPLDGSRAAEVLTAVHQRVIDPRSRSRVPVEIVESGSL